MHRRVMRYIVAAGLIVPSFAASAQDLGVQGTAAFNAIWTGTATRSDGFTLGEHRFSGRIAVRVGPELFVGASVGSLQSFVGITLDGTPLPNTTDAEQAAVLGSAYVQWYPLRRTSAFVRGGAGYAHTTTSYPSGSFIYMDSHVRATATVGLGLDVPLHDHLAATVSLDYTRLLGGEIGRELKASLLAGMGLTIR